MSDKVIKHNGYIESIENDVIKVRILATSACSSCSAKGGCSVSEIEEKIIDVENKKDKDYKKGDFVEIKMNEGLGMRAVILGYIIPLIIMVVSIIILLNFTSEGMAAVLGIFSLIPYYLFLYVIRQKTKSKFEFSLT